MSAKMWSRSSKHSALLRNIEEEEKKKLTNFVRILESKKFILSKWTLHKEKKKLKHKAYGIFTCPCLICFQASEWQSLEAAHIISMEPLFLIAETQSRPSSQIMFVYPNLSRGHSEQLP